MKRKRVEADRRVKRLSQTASGIRKTTKATSLSACEYGQTLVEAMLVGVQKESGW